MVFYSLLLNIVVIWKFVYLFTLNSNTSRHETVLSFNRNKYLLKLLGNHWTMGNIFIGTLRHFCIFLDHLHNQGLGWIRLNYLVVAIYLLVVEAIDIVWKGLSLSETVFLYKSIWNTRGAYNNLRHTLDLR
jgi:hypothetical protein